VPGRSWRPLGPRSRRHAGLPASEAEALGRVLSNVTFELLPLASVHERISFLPAGARVSVTASPARGLDATLSLAIDLQRRGFQAVPHLAARMVRDRAQLREILSRLTDGGVGRAFVVGGDATKPGEYPDGVSLLRAIADLGTGPAEIGIPCFPDGHPTIADDRLLTALREKLPFASWMTTQLCFDPARIGGWIAARRAEGIATPVLVGVAGVTEPQRLLAISARIGVRDSRRFVAGNLRFVARLVRSGGHYRPDALLGDLAPALADPGMRIAGLHIYTFNQVRATVEWRNAAIAGLGSGPGPGLGADVPGSRSSAERPLEALGPAPRRSVGD
jgi:methylenetetrahydrofolate reductase (NADPH)